MRCLTLILVVVFLLFAGTPQVAGSPPQDTPATERQDVPAPSRSHQASVGAQTPSVEITYVELVEAGVGERGTPGSVVPPARRRQCELHAAPAGPGGTQGENQHLPAL
jgi:hypothetical protein